MIIKNSTLLTDLFQHYPHLEERVAGILPAYKEITQKELLECVCNIARIEHVAVKAGMDVHDLVNDLRNAAGESDQDDDPAIAYLDDDPAWIRTLPDQIINGDEMLGRGIHPLQMIADAMEKLDPAKVILLLTGFEPIPLINAMKEKDYKVFSRLQADTPKRYLTFLGK